MNKSYSTDSPSGSIRTFTVCREDAEMLHSYIQEKKSVIWGLLAFIEDMRCEGRGVAKGDVEQFLLDWGLLAEKLKDKTWAELAAESEGQSPNFAVYDRASVPSGMLPMEIVKAVSEGRIPGTLTL